jgi:DNA-binding response OmpR family regulator
MMNSSNHERVLIIERENYWREHSVRALEARGFIVKELDHYEYSPSKAYFDGKPPDLVILGCAKIGSAERLLIHNILADKRHLIVLCTSLPWGDMRSVFLLGADDVADKPYDPNRLIKIVEHTFNSMSPRNSYESKEIK